jgi:inhibitor of KinA sporulation pathway (predicted exonuclease)
MLERGKRKMAELKQFVFFDFEMLCSNRGMSYENMEAIRLGAVKYNLETERIEYFDRFIRPKQQRPLTDFCKKLTGIEDSNLVHAQGFKTVFEDFLTWIGGVKRTRFFSWSSSDLSRLKLDASSHDISLTTIKKIEQRYIDFQAIFTKRVSKTNHSVENALALYNLSFEGEKHNPMYDAYNTLRIYLAFANERLQSDLIMLNKFIFDDKHVLELKQPNLNTQLKQKFTEDLTTFWADWKVIIRMKDAKKLLKRTHKMIRKYENILINRSDLFDHEIQLNIRLFVNFYQELVKSYEEHLNHDSKIIILHEQLYQPFQQVTGS